MAKKAAKASKGARIVPLGDKVVLKREVAESTTAGGPCHFQSIWWGRNQNWRRRVSVTPRK